MVNRTCIYPGCDRPVVGAHAAGGPPSAFCDREDHNALMAHLERKRRGIVPDAAYRAVFLRVHPTGKMVLSLTTEPDGNEPRYAQLVADALGVPALDVKVVPADENRFGAGHGFNTAPSGGTDAAIAKAADKILAKARLLAQVDLESEDVTWSDGAFAGAGGSRTIADIALYAHGSGALPPGVEGGLDAQTVYRD
jgi:carbon-monoxide dehydrogenase large subunit